MARNAKSDRSLGWVLLFLGLAAILCVLQIWNALSITHVVQSAETAAVQTSQEQLDHEKVRQELIGKRIENESRGPCRSA